MGIIIGGVAHFLAGAVVREVTSANLAQVPAGSWLMISAGMVEDGRWLPHAGWLGSP